MSKIEGLLVYVSSRNNYDMLIGEVAKHIDLSKIHFVNVDDHSDEEEKTKGKAYCKKLGIPYLENLDRGMQWSLKTVVEYAKDKLPSTRWVIHFQHDNYPLFPNFFEALSDYTRRDKVNEFGIVGFNHLSPVGQQTKNLVTRVKLKKHGIGMVGQAPIAKIPSGWWYNGEVIPMPWDLWKKPFPLEVLAMMSIGFNLELFDKHIEVTNRYHLQFWGQDICLQFGKKNIYCVVLPNLYTYNDMQVKQKYGIWWNSPKSNNPRYHGDYGPHFKVFRKRWGWDWEKRTFSKVADQYKGTLLWDFWKHDMRNGPLKSFTIGG